MAGSASDGSGSNKSEKHVLHGVQTAQVETEWHGHLVHHYSFAPARSLTSEVMVVTILERAYLRGYGLHM
jgi:hypothetical protein